MTSTRHLGWTALALLALVGCDAPAPTPAETNTTPADKLPKGENATEIKSLPVEPAKVDEPKKDEPKAEEPKKDEPKTAAAEPGFSAAEMAEIKKLAPEDQILAIAQGTCPVSDEKLGMDVPIKKVIDGKTFFICCGGCEKKVADDPKGVLAKLAK